MLCPDTRFHVSQRWSGSLTAFEVWDVSPSLCLWGVFTSATLRFWGGLAEHWLMKRPLGPSQTLILSHHILLLERSPIYSSLCHKKERGKEPWRVSRLADVRRVKMVCWKWMCAEKGALGKYKTASQPAETKLWASSFSSLNKTSLTIAYSVYKNGESQRNQYSHPGSITLRPLDKLLKHVKPHFPMSVKYNNRRFPHMGLKALMRECMHGD